MQPINQDKIKIVRQAITKKNEYQVGDKVVIATTDAVIPQDLSDLMEVTNYLRKGQRVRTVKLRGVYSECLIIPLSHTPRPGIYKEGDDMMKELNIFKYEPPVKMVQLSSGKTIRYSENPNFLIYYKFPNQKNVPDMFNEEDTVQITRTGNKAPNLYINAIVRQPENDVGILRDHSVYTYPHLL